MKTTRTAAEKKIAKMSDAEIAYTLKDLSDVLLAAVEMGRDGNDPKCAQYVAEMAAAQAEQSRRARKAA